MATITARSLDNLLYNSNKMTLGLAYRATVYLQQLSPEVAKSIDPRVIRTIAINIRMAGGPPLNNTLEYLGVE